MLKNDNNYLSMNNFMSVPKIPYKIFEHLLQNNSEECEMLWKLMKYPNIDCLDKPNLTYKEKFKLIWSGQSDEQNYRLFAKPLLTNSLSDADEMIQLRMFRNTLIPTTRLEATILFEINIITNDKTACVIYQDCLVERTDLIETLLLTLLNGKDIGIGYTTLRFDRELDRGSKSMLNLSNTKSLYGRSLTLALKYMETDIGGEDCN